MDEGKITITTSRLKGGFFRKRIMSKDNAFNRYPPIIHGEAQAENDEFVIHTRYLRFLARKSFSASSLICRLYGDMGVTFRV